MFFGCYGQLSLSEKLSSSSIVDIVVLERDLTSEKPVFQSHAAKLFDVANQGHYYIVNSQSVTQFKFSTDFSHGMRLRTPVTRGYFFLLGALRHHRYRYEKNILWNPGYLKSGFLSDFE